MICSSLEFNDKARLQEFVNKIRQLYLELSIVLTPVFRTGDHEICEWTLQNTMTEAASGKLRRKVPVSLTGTSIARVEQGTITRWADYYDRPDRL